MGPNEAVPVARLLEPGAAGVTPLPWEEACTRIDAARYYWLTTLHPEWPAAYAAGTGRLGG
ncbi:MAG TPA: hypothetical protein VMF65_11665 [Acidimicrobiales bacterium]|nr:hypothetical protein [Acidimicrobiales bacterium]